jgi:dihydroorotase
MATARALTILPRGGAARFSRRASSRAPVLRPALHRVHPAATTESLTITTPDDWHLHVRDSEKIADVVPFTARVFARALIMPNLNPPVRTVADARQYRDQILSAVPEGVSFAPQMTLYLTDNTSPADIVDAAKSGFVVGCKLYPAGATTNSDLGVTDIAKIYPALRAMAEHGLVLEVHGEVTHASVDMFDREKVFLEEVLGGLVAGKSAVPGLKIVMEHITTAEAVAFCEDAPATVAATITPQHVLYNRNAMLVGGIRPHLYCLPILKREKHRAAVALAAMSGNPKFFLGTDSAPHPRGTCWGFPKSDSRCLQPLCACLSAILVTLTSTGNSYKYITRRMFAHTSYERGLTRLTLFFYTSQGAKESACGCAGVFSAHAALPFYASAFEKEGKLDKLQGFASHYGADFYGVPRNAGTVTLVKKNWTVPQTYAFGNDVVVPFFAGEIVEWQVEGQSI